MLFTVKNRYSAFLIEPNVINPQFEIGIEVPKITIREVTKNNLPILLAFWPVFFVATIGEYPNMHLMPRLEYEPKFGAIMGGLFFVTSLNGLNWLRPSPFGSELLFKARVASEPRDDGRCHP